MSKLQSSHFGPISAEGQAAIGLPLLAFTHASAFSLAQQVGGGGRAVGQVEVQVEDVLQKQVMRVPFCRQ